jgi:hypothetical protein
MRSMCAGSRRFHHVGRRLDRYTVGDIASATVAEAKTATECSCSRPSLTTASRAGHGARPGSDCPFVAPS